MSTGLEREKRQEAQLASTLLVLSHLKWIPGLPVGLRFGKHSRCLRRKARVPETGVDTLPRCKPWPPALLCQFLANTQISPICHWRDRSLTLQVGFGPNSHLGSFPTSLDSEHGQPAGCRRLVHVYGRDLWACTACGQDSIHCLVSNTGSSAAVWAWVPEPDVSAALCPVHTEAPGAQARQCQQQEVPEKLQRQ